MASLPPHGRALVALRLMIGLGSWLAPNLIARLFFIDPRANPSLPFIMRLFGVRDAILAVGVLLTDGEDRGRWLRLGVAADLADAAAAELGRREGSLPTTTAVLAGATAVSAAALGVTTARSQ